MLYVHCGRILKARNRMVILKTIQRLSNFWDKGKAEENVFYLKQEKEKLKALRKKMEEMEASLDTSIKAIEKVVNITNGYKKDIESQKKKDTKSD
ncbi:uncharacterized protein LOC129246331 [Anastrepha obliqua]|uniref:uncharacterized protein LOC129246331 n=1 Tax=Anastrepha obliqua TaxID=95512 RepID=UPI002409349A|nr:uncharacterized protein LOC129246331 [Anastrepha obliqua]